MSSKRWVVYVALCEMINLFFLGLAVYGLIYHPADKLAALLAFTLGLPFWFIAGLFLYQAFRQHKQQPLTSN
jgi:uncharacterized membrane protein